MSKQISDFSDLALATGNVLLHETSAGGTTGKASFSQLVTFLEGQLTDCTDPANIDASLTGNATLEADIRDLAGGSATPTKSLADLVTHIAGSANKHDAGDITYETGTVENALDSLNSYLDTTLSTGLTRVVYNIIDLTKSSSEEYHDGTNVVLSEELLLSSIGIDNSSYAGFNYAISHNATVDVYIMTKASNYMTNLALATVDVRIAWTEDYDRIHLDSVTINDANMTAGDDVKIIIDAKVFKIFPTSIS